MDDLPTVRLGRLSVERLSDEDLIKAYYRVTAFAIRPALRKFAEAIVNRPTLADSEQRIHAYAALVRNEEDLTRALEYVEQGRRAAEAKKESSASWDLMELSLRFAARDGQQAMRLIQHLQERHLEEPGVRRGAHADAGRRRLAASRRDAGLWSRDAPGGNGCRRAAGGRTRQTLDSRQCPARRRRKALDARIVATADRFSGAARRQTVALAHNAQPESQILPVHDILIACRWGAAGGSCEVCLRGISST